MGTEYQFLMQKSDIAERRAVKYMQNGESSLARFYHNASLGYKQKALNLPLNIDMKTAIIALHKEDSNER